ncbi:MAG: GPW/gp25 family protein [Oscillospiraceae bacterium]|nr:GPW/gp25 family protein [Oscillospiraceae bacterium]
MDERTFLGTGMKFPPQIDPGTGRFALAAGPQSVKESLYIILMTSQGERWLEPDFGSQIMRYTFMDPSLTALNIMSNELRTLILEQEPRISEVDVQIDPEVKEGCLVVTIGYTITDSNTRDNLVFPFYLNAAGEEESHGPAY